MSTIASAVPDAPDVLPARDERRKLAREPCAACQLCGVVGPRKDRCECGGRRGKSGRGTTAACQKCGIVGQVKDRCKCGGRRGRSGRSGRSRSSRYQSQIIGHVREFIGVDGEGRKDADGWDSYTELRAGDQEVSVTPGERLTTEQIVAFLRTIFKPRRFAVMFGAGYDWQHWFRDISDQAWEKSRTPKGAWFTYGGYTYKLLRIPRKMITLFWWEGEFKKGKGAKMVVYDTWSFFGTSFEQALADWEIGDPDERAFVAEMKAKRGDFSRCSNEEIARYNVLECILIKTLIEKVDLCIHQVIGKPPSDDGSEIPDDDQANPTERGWWLKHFHGAGALASFMLQRRDIKEQIDHWKGAEHPPEVMDMLARAYFGGRFQVFMVGSLGSIYLIDICSAYPFQSAKLPSLKGAWRKASTYEPEAPYAVWNVRWLVGFDPESNPYYPVTPFPYRTDTGRIHYPPHGTGCYMQDEVRVARKLWGDQAIEVAGGYVWEPNGPSPLEFLYRLYDQRMKIGKSGKGLVIKLAMNSLYGKFAQRLIGDAIPPWRCELWASLITSGCRAMMLEMMCKCPRDLRFAATDGLAMTSPPPDDVSYGKALGQWEPAKKFVSGAVFQPGIYWLLNEEGELTLKARGIADKDLDEAGRETFLRHFAEQGIDAAVMITSKKERFLSRDLLIHLGHSGEDAFRWISPTKEIRLCPGSGFQNQWTGNWETWRDDVEYDLPSRRFKSLKDQDPHDMEEKLARFVAE